jgi:hypothetical protein
MVVPDKPHSILPTLADSGLSRRQACPDSLKIYAEAVG